MKLFHCECNNCLNRGRVFFCLNFTLCSQLCALYRRFNGIKYFYVRYKCDLFVSSAALLQEHTADTGKEGIHCRLEAVRERLSVDAVLDLLLYRGGGSPGAQGLHAVGHAGGDLGELAVVPAAYHGGLVLADTLLDGGLHHVGGGRLIVIGGGRRRRGARGVGLQPPDEQQEADGGNRSRLGGESRHGVGY